AATTRLTSEFVFLQTKGLHPDCVRLSFERQRTAVQTLVPMAASAGYYGDQSQSHHWARMIERVANVPGTLGVGLSAGKLCQYATLLVTYAGGITAVAAGRYYNLKAICVDPKIYD